jgi:DNA-binding transcriptional ArsR family regulator
MARPTSRTAVLTPPTPTAPARVRDFSRTAAPVAVTWDVRTLYDFVFSLSTDAGSTDDLPASDQAWLTSAKTGLQADVGDALHQYGADFCVVLASLAVDRPEARTSADLLDIVRAASSADILRTVLDDDLRDAETRQLAERALAGDADAQAELVEHIPSGHADKRQSFAAMLADPASVTERAARVLSAWQPRFAEIEDRIGSIIRRDADSRIEDAATLSPSDLIERTTGGIRWLSEPGVRRVILAPSYFARPYNYLLGGDGWRLFGYPVGDAALDPADPLAPPQAVIRLHRALGDETRLRILRLLRDRDLYLTEIAQALELSKPTIKHHLALLRSAGLVTLTEEGGLSYYSLRRQRLDDASTELKHFLVD